MIKLFDDWVIVVDDLSYALARDLGSRIDKKTGKDRKNLKTYGYYGSLAKALNAFAEELVRQELKDNVATLDEAVHIIRESNDRVEKLLKEVLPS